MQIRRSGLFSTGAFSAVVLVGYVSRTKYNFEKMNGRLLFGAALRWKGVDKKTTDWLTHQLDELGPVLNEAWDPDCYYRKTLRNHCPNPKGQEWTDAIQKASDVAHAETAGFFDVFTKIDGKTYRDYGGNSQSFLLEYFKEHAPGPFVADFAGDVFFSGGFEPNVEFMIPEVDNVKMRFAEVRMKSGWMTAAVDSSLGTDNRDPRTGKLSHTDIKHVVLFAKTSFDGARIDAWDTAIVAGGTEQLRHLLSLKKYQGEWAYFYYDRQSRPVCSPLLKCQLEGDAETRFVETPW